VGKGKEKAETRSNNSWVKCTLQGGKKRKAIGSFILKGLVRKIPNGENPLPILNGPGSRRASGTEGRGFVDKPPVRREATAKKRELVFPDTLRRPNVYAN